MSHKTFKGIVAVAKGAAKVAVGVMPNVILHDEATRRRRVAAGVRSPEGGDFLAQRGVNEIKKIFHKHAGVENN